MQHNLSYGNPHIWDEWYDGIDIGIHGRISSLYQLDQPRDNRLDECIRALHSHHGHTIDPSTRIVTGCGSTQVILGIIYAMIMHYKKVRFYEQIPYPPIHKDLVNLCGQEWTTNVNTIFNQPHIEFVTSPNNPDGSLRGPISSARVVLWDAVYAWPWYGYTLSQVVSHMKKVCDGKISIPIFSFSKSLGLAGERVGYALISSSVENSYPHFVQHYQHYVQLSTNGICRSGEGVCRVISTGYKEFPSITERIEERYDILTGILKMLIPSIHILSPRGFPYLWIYRQSHDLYRQLCNIGILGIEGSSFGMSNEYVRLSLLCSSSVFNDIISSLQS